MSYILDENDNHILDEDGNKIEYIVENIEGDLYRTETIHINDNGYLDTEDRHLVIKQGINDNHAVCKKQLDQLDTNTKEYINNKLSALQALINTSITALFKAHEAKILTQMLNFRNEQIKNRIQRKYIKIQKTPNKWIKLFDNSDVGDDVHDLKNIIILNVWIKKYYRYHNAKSALLEKEFDNSIQFYYNDEMTAYFTFFSSAPSNWRMDAIIEWLRIPQPISIDNENENENISIPKPENNSNE